MLNILIALLEYNCHLL